MAPTNPRVIHQGLAIYARGEGEPLLLLPYPHGSTQEPVVDGPLAGLLANLGHRVVTFDPPGAYRSTRPARVDMDEMLHCAVETLDLCQLAGPVDVAGHSMGSLCALGLALESPHRVRRLLLVGSLSGWPAVLRWSLPRNWRWWRDRAFWLCAWYGTRLMLGQGNLEIHKQLDNLVEEASFVDKGLAQPVPIYPGDRQRPPPSRGRWLRAVRSVDYGARLGEVRAPTLICTGRFDPQTPVACNEELARGIPRARLVIFESSGHAPFIEEPERFAQEVAGFLTQAGVGGRKSEGGGRKEKRGVSDLRSLTLHPPPSAPPPYSTRG